MTTLARRDVLKSMFATTALAGTGLPLLCGEAQAAPLKPASGTHFKRIIFFLQNHGFDPQTCCSDNVRESCPLSQVELAKPMKALEPYKDMMNVISGLHGRHTSVNHSAYFGALGGYRGDSRNPRGITVDCALSRKLPPSILPQLCVGMDALDRMKSSPAVSGISATGPGKGIDMQSNPTALYQDLFGSILTGDLKTEYDAELRSFRGAGTINAKKGAGLHGAEAQRYGQYLGGYEEIVGSRDRLAKVSDRLRKYAPKMDKRYTDPEFETDWHDALLEITIAGLQADISNVVTIASGRGTVGGSWFGIGVQGKGHQLGHMKQPGSDTWDKIRHYNCQMLVKLIEGLKAVPEGKGTMMDNTLIVYSSNNAEKQHSSGSKWPFVLIGSGGGQFKTGRFTHVEGPRPINDLYTTFLRAAGSNADHFNLSSAMANTTNSQAGPIEELLV